MRLRPIVSRSVLLLSSLTVSLVLAEICYRRVQLKRYERLAETFDNPVLRLDPATIVRLKANVKRSNSTPRRRSEQPAIEWTFSTDSRGMRVSSLSSSAPENIRILAVGDSYTLGWAVDDDQTYPHLLQAALRQRFPDASIEVVNGGVYAFNSWQEAQFLESVGDQVHPDIVVLGYVMNDANPAGFDKYVHPRTSHLGCVSWMASDLVREIQNLLYERWQQSSTYRAAVGYNNEFLEESRGWRESRDALRRMQSYCRERQIPFIVAVFPDVSRKLDETYPFTPIHQAVQHWGGEDGYSVIDLLPEFRFLDRRDMSLEGEGHPNRRAYQLIATRIAKGLEPYLVHLEKNR